MAGPAELNGAGRAGRPDAIEVRVGTEEDLRLCPPGSGRPHDGVVETTMDFSMDFGVSEYVPRPFSDVVADVVRWASVAFAEATAEANRELPHESAVLGEGPGGLTVELGDMRVATWRAMDLPVRWRSSRGSLVIDATFRVLPVQDGRENPVTEVLLHGAFGTEAARRMHPVAWVRQIVEVIGQRLTTRTTGDPRGEKGPSALSHGRHGAHDCEVLEVRVPAAVRRTSSAEVMFGHHDSSVPATA